MRGIVIIIASIFVSSCTTQLETFVAHPPVDGWYKGATIEIEVPNNDTTAVSELSIFVRYRSPQQRATLRAEITTTSPDSVSFTEPFTISPTGESKLYEVRYRTNVEWRASGSYTIGVTPQRDVRGIEAIGVKKIDK